MNSQAHNLSPAVSAKTVPAGQLSPLSPRGGDSSQAPDLRFYPTVPTVPDLSPSRVQLSPSPPLYSGDRGQDRIRDTFTTTPGVAR